MEKTPHQISHTALREISCDYRWRRKRYFWRGVCRHASWVVSNGDQKDGCGYGRGAHVRVSAVDPRHPQWGTKLCSSFAPSNKKSSFDTWTMYISSHYYVQHWQPKSIWPISTVSAKLQTLQTLCCSTLHACKWSFKSFQLHFNLVRMSAYHSLESGDVTFPPSCLGHFTKSLHSMGVTNNPTQTTPLTDSYPQ